MPLPRLPRKLGDMLSDKEPSESALTPVAAKVAKEKATQPKTVKPTMKTTPRKATSSVKSAKPRSRKDTTKKPTTATDRRDFRDRTAQGQGLSGKGRRQKTLRFGYQCAHA